MRRMITAAGLLFASRLLGQMELAVTPDPMDCPLPLATAEEGDDC